jgi:hypothetical protein
MPPEPHWSAHSAHDTAGGSRTGRSASAANASVTRVDASMLASPLPVAGAARALGSEDAQPALPQCFGSGVAVGWVAQLPVPHKPSALPGSATRITENVCSAVLTNFSRALCGRTQPMPLHSAGARSSPLAQFAFWQARVCVLPNTSARAAKNERRCMGTAVRAGCVEA